MAVKHKPSGEVHKGKKGGKTGCGVDTRKKPSHWVNSRQKINPPPEMNMSEFRPECRMVCRLAVVALVTASMVFAITGCASCSDDETTGPMDAGSDADEVSSGDVMADATEDTGGMDDSGLTDTGQDVADADVFDDPASDFTSGPDGWIAVDLRSEGADYGTVLQELDDLQWADTGGLEGGYLFRVDTTSEAFFFDAPSDYLGDLSAYAGGTLSFALRSTHATWTGDDYVVLVSNDTVIVTEIAPPGEDWTTYEVPLEASQFTYDSADGEPVPQEDFEAVLSNVTALRISGEWGPNVEETVGFDSVELSPATE